MSKYFDLKGEVFTATVLYLKTIDLKAVEEALVAKVKISPAFFNQIPVVVDLSEIDARDNLDFTWLKNLLISNRIIPVALRSVPEALESKAMKADWAFLPEQNAPKTVSQSVQKPQERPPVVERIVETKEVEVIKEVAVPSTVVTHQVRSGQQIAIPSGDLIIINTVNEGAELLATGNIHVYGPLRGRALAGINGNRSARIFCQSLEAELVSIAGQYKVIDEEISALWTGKAVQIYLEHDEIKIERIF
ncbi:septum site-determining protein MinC [Ignatzschineria sp. RMDPL8A]|uniref:septum site-determining protein MinC n=1 Tax=Ignatzschineria sp. RMDPL8A TaxID=2999236 RepID=UPI0024466A67|nr:septum site-determining protein MinC [Ignatzschineria sp. RMDPL8A]MDG9729270.1 septum site-determining protein MinC [Ignatzschineria sp. RMDPL8A]